MATNEPTTKERFFRAVNEANDALIDALEATEERGHRVSRQLLREARKGERELTALAEKWAETPTSLFENLQAGVEVQTRGQGRALELARDALKGAGEYRAEVQDALRRIISANREAAEAVAEAARSMATRAADQADQLPRLRRVRPEMKRPTRIRVTDAEVAERKAG